MNFLENTAAWLLQPEDQAIIDQSWVEATGLASIVLMETAAQAVFQEIKASFAGWPIEILLGSGNNAGDGWALARLLVDWPHGLSLIELFPDRRQSPDCQAMAKAAKAMGLTSKPWQEWRQTGDKSGRRLIIDAIYGSGFKLDRPLSPEFKELEPYLQAARQSGSKVLAIDSPSGLDSNNGLAAPLALRADYSMSFLAPKLALLTEEASTYSGQIKCLGLGMPKAWWQGVIKQKTGREFKHFVCDHDLAKKLMPKTKPDVHKGSFKKLQITGGDRGMAGACLLAARASLKAGASYVYLDLDQSLLGQALGQYPELIISSFKAEEARAKLNRDQVIPVHLVGPGGGKLIDKETLAEFICRAPNLVIDADGLNLLAREPSLWPEFEQRSSSPAILTPHLGEFKRLFPDLVGLPIWQAVSEAARSRACIIVCKGHRTVTGLPSGQVVFNPTGNLALARAGSGDSLGGIIAALICRGLQPAEAAILGVYCHGRAADLALTQRHQMNLRIVEIVDDYLGQAFAELEE